MTDKPRRRVVATVKVGADSWNDLASALNAIAFEIRTSHLRGGSVSGGYAWGYIFEADEDRSVTHESYHAANDRWLREQIDADRKATGKPR